jgi:4-methyl-5(b-hydroxyethyl)-thiazole monophosphate biosynthesis
LTPSDVSIRIERVGLASATDFWSTEEREMAKKAIIVLAEGFEEIEAVTPADILRRAGVEVELVGLEATEVTGAHGITFGADRVLAEREDADAVILPGGLPGADNLAASAKLAGVLEAQAAAGKLVAAICASPGCVLAKHGLLDGKKATCYPSFEERFDPSTTYATDAVVKDGNILTSRGPGTAFAFGLALARELAGAAKADELAQAMLYVR